MPHSGPFGRKPPNSIVGRLGTDSPTLGTRPNNFHSSFLADFRRFHKDVADFPLPPAPSFLAHFHPRNSYICIPSIEHKQCPLEIFFYRYPFF